MNYLKLFPADYSDATRYVCISGQLAQVVERQTAALWVESSSNIS